MEKSIAIIISIGFCFNLVAQNLVQNSSFEDYDTCPPDIGWGFNSYITYADFWDFSSPSPDFFHVCGGTNSSVPNNYFGDQIAASGNGYAGFSAYQSSFGIINGREGVITMLSDTLQVGQTYFCSFKVSLAEKSVWACNNIGMYFSTDFHQVPFSTQTQYSQVNASQIYEPSIISDSTNWITISGSFVADSNYLYLSITNHFDDLNTDIVSANPNGFYGVAYYYLDDVCVSLYSNTCGFISNGLHSIQKEITPDIYPNPATESILIDLEGIRKHVSVEIYSLAGYLIKQIRTDNTDKIEININDVPNGMYLVKIKLDSTFFNKMLIVK